MADTSQARTCSGAVAVKTPVLSADRILLDADPQTRREAVELGGRLLVSSGAVSPDYVAAMHRRERSITTYLGRNLAVPHGSMAAKQEIVRPVVSVLRLKNPVDWRGESVRYVVSIAAQPHDHLKLLGRIGRLFDDTTVRERLDAATTPAEVLDALGSLNN